MGEPAVDQPSGQPGQPGVSGRDAPATVASSSSSSARRPAGEAEHPARVAADQHGAPVEAQDGRIEDQSERAGVAARSKGEAAVDGEHGAGHGRRFRTRQPRQGGRHLIRVEQPADRLLACELVGRARP